MVIGLTSIKTSMISTYCLSLNLTFARSLWFLLPSETTQERGDFDFSKIKASM